MTINEEALKLAVKGIEAIEDNWDQRQWIGKTVAGLDLPEPATVASRTGGVTRRKRGKNVLIPIEKCDTTFCLAGMALFQAGMVDENGQFTDGSGENLSDANVPDAAGDLLGLTPYQASSIFFWGTEVSPTGHRQQGALEEFKQHITDVTGVVFDG